VNRSATGLSLATPRSNGSNTLVTNDRNGCLPSPGSGVRIGCLPPGSGVRSGCPGFVVGLARRLGFGAGVRRLRPGALREGLGTGNGSVVAPIKPVNGNDAAVIWTVPKSPPSAGSSSEGGSGVGARCGGGEGCLGSPPGLGRNPGGTGRGPGGGRYPGEGTKIVPNPGSFGSKSGRLIVLIFASCGSSPCRLLLQRCPSSDAQPLT